MNDKYIEIEISSKDALLGKAILPFDCLERCKNRNYRYVLWLELFNKTQLNISFKKLDKDKLSALKKSLKDKVVIYKKSHHVN